MNVDVVIVGFGIAGAAVAHKCVKANKSFLIFDDNKISASKISAGMFTPIRGKRFVYQDNYTGYINSALKFYNDCQLNIGSFSIVKKHIERVFNSLDDKNLFLEKYKNIKDIFTVKDKHLLNILNVDNGAVFFNQSGYLDVPRYLELSKVYFTQKDMFRVCDFDYGNLKIEGDDIKYEDVCAQHIIFTEGFNAVNNPFFNFIPFQNAKSEVLLIKCKGFNFDHIINAGVWIKPMDKHTALYLVGSTHSWDEFSLLTTKRAREELMNRLNQLINVPFTVIDQQAAVKPIIKDRKIVWGTLRDKPVSILNGLGSSGVLKSPYYAGKLIDSLITKNVDHGSMHIERFF